MFQTVPVMNAGRLGLRDAGGTTNNPMWGTRFDNMTVLPTGAVQVRRRYSQSGGLFSTLAQTFTRAFSSKISGQQAIACNATTIYGDDATVLTPTTTPTGGFWQFFDFNGSVYGWQASHTPIVTADTTATAFADVTVNSGTLPDGNCAVAAFGRIWAADDDQQTIRYCALLDPTRWDEADGGGTIDMHTVWTLPGQDEIVALGALGPALVVFGKRHIVLWVDGQGSELGIDPTQIMVQDVVQGVGCIARDTVIHVGEGDIWFASKDGVTSLIRAVQSDAATNPLDTISWPIYETLRDSSDGANVALRAYAVYSDYDDIVYFSYGVNTDLYAFHVGSKMPDPETGRMVYPASSYSYGTEAIWHLYQDGDRNIRVLWNQDTDTEHSGTINGTDYGQAAAPDVLEQSATEPIIMWYVSGAIAPIPAEMGGSLKRLDWVIRAGNWSTAIDDDEVQVWANTEFDNATTQTSVHQHIVRQGTAANQGSDPFTTQAVLISDVMYGDGSLVQVAIRAVVNERAIRLSTLRMHYQLGSWRPYK